MKTKIHFTLIPIVVLLAACSAKEKVNIEDISNHVTVELATVKWEKQPYLIKGSGLIFSDNEAKLAFKSGGVVRKVYVKEGDRVLKDQLLASLDLTEIDAQVSQANNALAKTKRDLDRIQVLYRDSAATLEQFQNTTTSYQAALDNSRIANFNRQFSEIHASTTGTITRKLVNEGELVSANTPVFFMNSILPGDWILKMGVTDKEWVSIKKGDHASVELDAYADLVFNGHVSRIVEGADPSSGLYQIEVSINTQGNQVASGMFAKATIETSLRTEFAIIPVESLVEGNGKNAFVFIPKGKENVERLPVRVSYLAKNQAYIAAGLNNVTKVITSGSGYLTVDSGITIKN